MAMTENLDWERDGRDWPLRTASRFVQAGGLRWHVQVMGQGPVILLLHGTGAASHSWRGVAPLLARRFTVIAPDLPGHGFTTRPAAARQSITGMAAAILELLRVLQAIPQVVVGHSAGAALLARMCLDGGLAPRALVSINGALLPLPGLPGLVFSPLAKALAQVSAVPRLFAWHAAGEPLVAKLIQDTGSVIDAQGIELYRRLASNPRHVGAALDMMAHWDLWQLRRDLPRLRTPLLLLAGSNDKTIAPADLERVRALLPQSRSALFPGLGHLAHEEQPRRVAAVLLRATRASLVPRLPHALAPDQRLPAFA